MNKLDYEIPKSKMLDQIRPSGIRKMFARAQGIEGLISLGIGAPDIEPPKEFNQIISEIDTIKPHTYTLNSGTLELRQKIVENYKNVYNLDYEQDGVVIGTGGTEMLFGSLFAMLNKGDEVIIPDPGFVYYPVIPELAGGKSIRINLDDNFQMNGDDIAEQINANTKIIITNTPSNPTGTIYTEETMKAIADLAIDNNLVILSDEVYEYMVFDGKKHRSFAEFAPDNTIIINSFSKTYCIPGWRLGFAIANPQLIEPLAKFHPYIVANAPSVPQYVISQFMGSKEDFLYRKQICTIMEERRDVVNAEFQKIQGIDIPKITGSFYAFPKITHEKFQNSSNPGESFVEDIFSSTKVVLVAASEFGYSRNEHFRVSFGSASKELISEAANRISEHLDNL